MRLGELPRVYITWAKSLIGHDVLAIGYAVIEYGLLCMLVVKHSNVCIHMIAICFLPNGFWLLLALQIIYVLHFFVIYKRTACSCMLASYAKSLFVYRKQDNCM